MIPKIQSDISSFRLFPPSQKSCPLLVQNSSDILLSSEIQIGFVKRIVDRSFSLIRTLFQKSISFLCSTLFCCVNSRFSTLALYERNVDFIGRLSTEFCHSRKKLSDPSLKKWWLSQFSSLDPQIQKLLLVEDMILRAPQGLNKRKWAIDHFDRYRRLSTQFVAELNEEVIGGKSYNPKFEVPKLLEGLHTYLAVEIDRLQRLQE